MDKCSPAHSDKVSQRSFPSLCTDCGAFPGDFLGHVLPSTGSAGATVFPLFACFSGTMLCPTSEWPYEPDVRHIAFSGPPSICALYLCSSFPSEQNHLRCTGAFFFFVYWIPLFQLLYGGFLPDLPIPAHEASTHAKF